MTALGPSLVAGGAAGTISGTISPVGSVSLNQTRSSMAESKGVIKEFKDFILRGNVVDLAVAVVIGTAFGAVVKALVTDIITPIISIPGKTNFQSLHFNVRSSVFAYGDLLNAIVT